MTQPRTRRAFVEWHELPGLLAGSAWGRAPRLRRIVGARRAGRYGVLLALSSAALAFGPQDLLLAVLGHLLLCGLGLAFGNRAARLAPYAYLRLAAWPVTLPLLLAAALRLAPGAGTEFAWLALLAGHALLWRGLRSGLHAPSTGELPA